MPNLFLPTALIRLSEIIHPVFPFEKLLPIPRTTMYSLLDISTKEKKNKDKLNEVRMLIEKNTIRYLVSTTVAPERGA